MKLKALEIENFKGIKNPIKILINEIVVLIGPNNCCKSTVLDAYEAYFSLGSALKLTDFNDQDISKPVRITGIFDDITEDDIKSIGQEWFIADDQEYGNCSKFQFEWNAPDEKGKKFSFSNKTNTWKPGGAGGWDSILKSKLPVPIRISPFDTTDKLETIVKDLIAKEVSKSIAKDKTKITKIVDQIRVLGKEIEKEISSDLNEINDSLIESMQSSFPDTGVIFDTNVGKFEPEKSIKEGSQFIFTTNNMKAPLCNQGSGIQRAFLWSAIKAYASKGILKKGRMNVTNSDPKVLLLDEPEVNLHPSVVRSAREALYALSEVAGWQIICTTHSPVFIDLSKDHTTIIKVSNNQESIRYFQTEESEFSTDEKNNLKMINLCNPLTNEFFFYENIVLVEGETEETALKILCNKYDTDGFHILNCRGKANIPTYIKIINKFKSKAIALHDSDTETTKAGKRNPMWTINKRILEECQKSSGLVYPIVHITDFEDYYLGESIEKDKPYNVYQHILRDDFDTNPKYEKLRKLVFNLSSDVHPNKYISEDEFLKITGKKL